MSSTQKLQIQQETLLEFKSMNMNVEGKLSWLSCLDITPEAVRRFKSQTKLVIIFEFKYYQQFLKGKKLL